LSKSLYRKAAVGKSRPEVLALAGQSLLDLCATESAAEGAIHYDAIAFAPTRIKRLKPNPDQDRTLVGTFAVDERLDFHPFVHR
jgi:hypothetical protein